MARKVRAVLDTSVLISGYLTRGLSSEIVRLGRSGKFKIIISSYIADEFVRALARRLPEQSESLANWIKKVCRKSIVVPENRILKLKIGPIIPDDPKDDPVIKTGLAGKSQCIVSYDPHILALKTFRRLEMLHPADFMRKTRR